MRSSPSDSALVSGILAVILGILILVWPGKTLLVAAILFGIYLLITGISQVLIDPGSTIPLVGASGAISGVLGAYIVLFPHGRIRSLVILGDGQRQRSVCNAEVLTHHGRDVTQGPLLPRRHARRPGSTPEQRSVRVIGMQGAVRSAADMVRPAPVEELPPGPCRRQHLAGGPAAEGRPDAPERIRIAVGAHATVAHVKREHVVIALDTPAVAA